MATALKLKNDINKLKAALRSKATPKSFLPKLKSQLEKAEADYESVKAGKKSAPKASKQVKSTMDKLKAIIKKKKYGAYRAQGVDLKKDADIPALPTGKRISKSGNTYYEYRANRIDVKQPPKRYPKLEKGGEVWSIGEYQTIEDWNSGTKKDGTKNTISAEGYPIRKNGVNVYVVKSKKEAIEKVKRLNSKLADGGYMAKGGFVVKAWQTKNDYENGNAQEVGKFQNIQDAHLLVDDYLSPNKFEWYAAEIYDANDGETLYHSEDDGYTEMAGGGDLSSIKKKYEKNEDENAHSENVVLLAKHFGTKEELAEAKRILALHEKEGHLSSENGKKRQALHLKLIEKASEEMSKQGIEFAKGGYMADGGTIDNSGITPADLQNQIWNLTARIAKLGDIESRAAIDEIEMLMKQRKKLQSMALNHGDVVMAQGGELHRSQEEKFKYGGYMAGGNTDKTQEIFFFVKPRLVSELTEKANNEKVELEFIETNEDGNEVYRAELTDSQINDFTKLPLQYDFNYDYAKGGYMADGGEIKKIVGKKFRPFTATSSNEYNVEIVDIDFDNVTYKYKDGEVKKAKTSDFLDSYIQVKEKGGYMAEGGNIFSENYLKIVLSNAVYHFYKGLNEVEAAMSYLDKKGQGGLKTALSKKFKLEDLKESIEKMDEYTSDEKEKGGYMAKGGATEHGLKKGDTILDDQFWDNTVIVDNPKTGRAVVNLENGKRKESKD